jgi:hypothetical protein
VQRFLEKGLAGLADQPKPATAEHGRG